MKFRFFLLIIVVSFLAAAFAAAAETCARALIYRRFRMDSPSSSSGFDETDTFLYHTTKRSLSFDDDYNSLAGVDELEVTEGGDEEESKGEEKDSNDGKNHQEDRKAMWATLKNMIGADVMSVFSVPVFIMEPMSTLQKMAEILQYQHLLDEAADEDDEDARLALVTAYAVSVYSTMERTKKPFNPILGETYELKLNDGKSTAIYEQVSHHPPIGAGHADTEKWTYDITSAVKTKFMGNWVDVFPIGRTRIHLKRTNETFNIVPPTSRINNLIVGRIWVDTFGDMRVQNLTTKATCDLQFTACGWSSRGRYEVNGFVKDKDGKEKLKMYGHWNKDLKCSKVKEDEKREEKKLWEVEESEIKVAHEHPYGFNSFAVKSIGLETTPADGKMLKSDSRLRPDRRALEKADNSTASTQKTALEERQRAERRERRALECGPWKPRFFLEMGENAECTADEAEIVEHVFEYNKNSYEEIREKEEACTNVGTANNEGEENSAKHPLDAEFHPWQFEKYEHAYA